MTLFGLNLNKNVKTFFFKKAKEKPIKDFTKNLFGNKESEVVAI